MNGYDDLDVALAAEDHRRGRSFGDPGHCARCDEVFRIANCRHDEMVMEKTFAGVIVIDCCADCGASTKDILSKELDGRLERGNPDERPTVPDWAREYEKGR